MRLDRMLKTVGGDEDAAVLVRAPDARSKRFVNLHRLRVGMIEKVHVTTGEDHRLRTNRLGECR